MAKLTSGPILKVPHATIQAGWLDAGAFASLVDRRTAIELAIDIADSGDMVVIAGKGHEDYQILADRTIHFDDREVAARALQDRG